MSDENPENTNGALVPVDEPQDDGQELSAPPPKVVTRVTARRALKKMGKSNLKLDFIEAKAGFGQYVAGLGVGNLTAADFVQTVHDLDSTIAATVALDAQLKDPEARANLMATREKLLKQRVALIDIGFKAGIADVNSQTQNHPNNIPFPANTQVNVLVSTRAEETTVKS